MKQTGTPTKRAQKIISLRYTQSQNGRYVHSKTNIAAKDNTNKNETISFIWQAALITGSKIAFPFFRTRTHTSKMIAYIKTGDRRKFCVIDALRQYENLRLSQE